MILIEDTRQQRLKHNVKREYFRSKGIVLRKEALDCGDYTLITDRSVVVDTKKDIQELIGDIQVKQMPLKEIIPNVAEIYDKYGIAENVEDMSRMIYDSDVGRFPEVEILEYCNKHDFPDEVEKKLQNLYVSRHGFFHRGLKRSEHGQVKLYVLVENNDGVRNLDDLKKWENPRLAYRKRTNKVIGTYKNGKPKYLTVRKFPTAMTGEKLSKACRTMQERYGTTFLFTTPEESGRKILELLGVEVN